MPMFLTPECRELLSKLIVADPVGRLSIRQIKKHSFFKKFDWKVVSEGKLKMPKPNIRPIVKSVVPLSVDSDDDYEDEDN
jgi:serine/threonine protein kinase